MTTTTEAGAVIRCKTCDAGTMRRKTVHRMSSVVVVIGYILLVPSVLGMMLTVATCFQMNAHPSGSAGADAIGTGISVVFFIGALVGGLLGWLLIMKKTILQCDHCGAVVAAS